MRTNLTLFLARSLFTVYGQYKSNVWVTTDTATNITTALENLG